MASRTALVLLLNVLFFTMISSSYATATTCPIDTLKLGVCANVLGFVTVQVGSPPTLPCCSLINGLLDLEAAACLCTALKLNILGLNLNIPLSLTVLLNVCGKSAPGYICA